MNKLPLAIFLLLIYYTFNGSTHIRFVLSKPGAVELTIYNTLGQIVKIEKRMYGSAGEKTITWNAEDGNKILFGSGIYFYKLKSIIESSKIAKMILLK